MAVWEVLSPEDSYMRVKRKLADYAAMGIGEIWVVDPETGVFERYGQGHLVPGDRFSIPVRAMDFRIGEIAKLVR